MYKSMRECEEMLTEIEERGIDLTSWETEFIDGLCRFDSYTPKQREIIDRIHTDRVRS